MGSLVEEEYLCRSSTGPVHAAEQMIDGGLWSCLVVHLTVSYRDDVVMRSVVCFQWGGC